MWTVWNDKGELVSTHQLTFLTNLDDGKTTVPVALVIRPTTGALVFKAFRQRSKQVLSKAVFYEGKTLFISDVIAVGRRLDINGHPGIVFAVWKRGSRKRIWYAGIVSDAPLEQIWDHIEMKLLSPASPRWLLDVSNFLHRLLNAN